MKESAEPMLADAAYHARIAAVLAGSTCELADDTGFAKWAASHRLASWLGALQPELRSLHLYRTLDAADFLARQSWLGQLLDRLEERGARPVLFKGVGVAHLDAAYGVPEHRPLGDVDILVAGAVRDSISVCREVGFRPLSEDPQALQFQAEEHYQVPLVHPQFGLLELHHALYRDVPSAILPSMITRTSPVQAFGSAREALAPPDLFFVLAVHLAQNPRRILFVWLLDLCLLSRSMDRRAWAGLVSVVADAAGHVFVAAAVAAIEELWGPAAHAVPGSVLEHVAGQLSWLERLAVQRTRQSVRVGSFNGDELMAARRLSGGEVRGRLGLLGSFWLHPGAVVLQTGLATEAPGFWRRRVGFTVARVQRGLRSVQRLLG